MSKYLGSISSANEYTSKVGADILREGGNAWDAIVAAGFASAVSEFGFTSVGGGGFMLSLPINGEPVVYDFFVDSPGKGLSEEVLAKELNFDILEFNYPGAFQLFHIGKASVAVPGNLKGLLYVHEKKGKLPLEQLLRPAIELARNGVIVNRSNAEANNLVLGTFNLTEEGKRIFTNNGKAIEEGEMAINLDFANFLSTLHLSKDELYRGELAKKIAADIDNIGWLTLKDLEEYQVIERTPLTFTYRGRLIYSNDLPSWGGLLVRKSLKLLEQFSLEDIGEWGSFSHLSILATIMEQIDVLKEKIIIEHGQELDEKKETDDVKEIIQSKFFRGTTHISVADAEGNVATMTTSNGEGSGYIVPNTGIMLNNMLGEEDLKPADGTTSHPIGARVASMMSPTILMNVDGTRAEVVIGSAGSKRIKTALFQIISNCVDFNMPMDKAISASRIHSENGTLQVEPGFDSDVLEKLKQGFTLNYWATKSLYFGGANGVGDRIASGDERRQGYGIVVTID